MQVTKNSAVSLLSDHPESVARKWVQTVLAASGGRVGEAEIERDLRPIFDALCRGVERGELDARSSSFDELRAILGEFSTGRARQGFTPSETAIAVFALKDAVFSSLDADSTVADFAAFSKFVDDLGLMTFETYAQTREAVIASQSEELLELSTPVVKLWDGVLAVPLVGTLDSARTQVVMESLLQMLVTTGSAHAIIDITGVAAVDTQVAQHLLKTVIAARLMALNASFRASGRRSRRRSSRWASSSATSRPRRRWRRRCV